MRVLVIGATGVLGRPAVRRLLAAGHDVTALARNDSRAAVMAAQGVTPVVGDLFDVDSLARMLVGREAVLNLATRIPGLAKAATGRGWAENDRVREDGSRALVTAALAGADVRIIVQEGIAYHYADGGDTVLDESSPIDAPGPLRSSLRAHSHVERFAADAGRVGVRLRIGTLYGDDPLTHGLLRAARFGFRCCTGMSTAGRWPSTRPTRQPVRWRRCRRRRGCTTWERRRCGNGSWASRWPRQPE